MALQRFHGLFPHIRTCLGFARLGRITGTSSFGAKAASAFRGGDFVSPKHLSTFRGVAVCQYTKYEGRNIAINIGRIDEKQPLEMQIDVCEGCDQPLETEKVVLRTLSCGGA